jgi:hypothetical protein
LLIEHNYSQSIIYNFKSELKFWKKYNVIQIIIVMIVISGIIIREFLFDLKKFLNYLAMINVFTIINVII